MYTLSFATSHASITAFQQIELPSFTVITGKNGSGKTHLLQAITSGAIRASCAPNQTAQNQTEAKYFDWLSLVPQDPGAFSSESLKNERLGIFNNYRSVLSQPNSAEQIRALLRNNGITDAAVLSNIGAMISLSENDDDHPLMSSIHNISSFRNDFKNVLQSVIKHISNFFPADQFAFLNECASMTKKSVLCLEEVDILTANAAAWGQNQIFQHAFHRLFVAYRDALLLNDIKELRKLKGFSNDTFLSQDEFVKRFGPPPWDFVNETIAAAGLDFSINMPPLHENGPYQARLTKKSTGAGVPFQNLSSGEKVLISLAFCVYYSTDKRQSAPYPKLLLLDEIDAPLHPSMTKSMISSIRDALVDTFNINVILTTHSSTTVALAPEGSVYVMQSSKGVLAPTSKAQALNILTEGVPTMSLSFEGRRQVFVESPADAKNFEALNQIIKSAHNNERTLQFIATGTGSANSGCAIVRQIVNDLVEAGNFSVFGLLDWDGRNEPSPRIEVLAHKTRNGLENVVFDPLAMVSLLCREFPAHKHEVGIEFNLDYRTFCTLNPSKYQPHVDKFVELVLKSPPVEKATARYMGGFSLNYDVRYMTKDDHELEEDICKVMPFIRGVTKQQAGLLMQYIIDKVLLENPGFMPCEIPELFSRILCSEAHID